MDEPEQTTEQVVEPEAAETATAEESTDKAPWGDDFDAERAWNTIQNLRSENKSVKEEQRKSLLTDDEFAAELLRERGWEFDSGEEDEDLDLDEEEDDDPHERRLSQLEQQQQAQQQEAALAEFDGHLDRLASKAEVELSDSERGYLLSVSHDAGFTPKSTEKAFEGWLEDRKAHDKAVIERYVKSKQEAPGGFKAGSEATEKLDMSDDQVRQKWMAEQWAQARAQN